MKAPKNNLCRAATFELRAASEGDGFTLEGYAAVFDSPTRIDSWEGTFDEVLKRGAFTKTINERTPVLQFDHGRDVATGSVPIGSIDELREDKTGLYVKARLHDNPRVEPIRQAIASGAIDGMSFRFRVLQERWTAAKQGTNEVDLREISEVDLFELGPVVFPAYESTTVGVRSLLAGLDDDDRLRLIADLARDLAPLLPGAAPVGTPGTPTAAPAGTEGLTHGERDAFIRSLSLTRSTP